MADTFESYNTVEDRSDICLWPLSPIEDFDTAYAGSPEAEINWSRFLEDHVHPKDEQGKANALERVRVLDCGIKGFSTRWYSSLLSELGAETIMVEPPGGDPARKYVPFGRKKWYFKDRRSGEECGPHFIHECRNKQSITLNLETEEGRALMKKLAVHADVIVENYPPGQFDAWGIGYRQLSKINPRLIYVWLGQRGQWGPKKDLPWMLEPTGQAASGFVWGTGAPKAFGGHPTRSGIWVFDHVAGTGAAMNTVAALLYRDTVSGKGQFIENTTANGNIRIIDYQWVWYGYDGSIRPRYGNWDLAINIYAVNPVKDGLLMVGGGHDRLWYRIWKAVGKERPELEEMMVEDEQMRVVIDRLPHYSQVKTYTLLSEWGKDLTRLESEGALFEEEVAAGGVLFTDEVSEYKHFKYRVHVAMVDTEHYGKVLYGTSPLQSHRTPARVRFMGRPVGYDNDDVFRRLCGLTRDQMIAYREANVI